MKKIFILILMIGTIAVLESCHELDLVPTDRETEATFWDKPEDAFNVLNTIYENMYRDEYFFYNETSPIMHLIRAKLMGPTHETLLKEALTPRTNGSQRSGATITLVFARRISFLQTSIKCLALTMH